MIYHQQFGPLQIEILEKIKNKPFIIDGKTTKYITSLRGLKHNKNIPICWTKISLSKLLIYFDTPEQREIAWSLALGHNESYDFINRFKGAILGNTKKYSY